MDLMGIGEFARLAELSPKALRLADELDLLVRAGLPRAVAAGLAVAALVGGDAASRAQ